MVTGSISVTIMFSGKCPVVPYLVYIQCLNETAGRLAGLPFKLHDFGFRGSTSVEVCEGVWWVGDKCEVYGCGG